MNLNFKDIEVINDKMGKPNYVKNKKLQKLFKIILKSKILNFFYQFLTKKNIQLHLQLLKNHEIR